MDGGCLCGAVRYTIEAPPLASGICHCETCRRATSATSMPFLTVATAAFRLTSGTPVEYRSSPPVVRRFCGRCGSPLTYWREDNPDELDVMTVSLDAPEAAAAAPTYRVWLSEALAWDPPGGRLAAHARSRQDANDA